METKHTPGPWHVENVDEVCFTTEDREDDNLICECGGNAENARLIAAAPDLLEALRDLTARCDGSEGVRPDGSNIQTMRAHAVLAKVEGG